MTLELFQEATVAAAVKALTRRSGSRRFLIADEVGLGKTVSAKAIAAELQHKRGVPLNVVYLSPNLDIAAQNLTKLRALAPTWARPEDRLSLVMQQLQLGNSTKFRVYCYTPDTSLPGWKAGQRTGRAAERALIAALLCDIAPRLWNRVRALDRARATTGKASLFPPQSFVSTQHLKGPFEAALRVVMRLIGKPLDHGLVTWLKQREDDVAELVLRARGALALAALRNSAYRPHLLILDEFHRYADLIIRPGELPKDELAKERDYVHRLLVDALIGDGEDAPALLLLSATPYRLKRLDRGEIEGGRYGHFVQLVRFLHGRVNTDRVAEIEAAIGAHHDALERRGDSLAAITAVTKAKRALEARLRPFIARTERATTISGELFERRDRPATIEPRDLVTFRHLARAVDKKAQTMRSWVQPLWSSVPYPAEMLFNYQVCKALGRDLPPVTIVAEKGSPAHPQLRALVEKTGDPAATINCDFLSLPWLAPTQSWWALGGRWRELADTDQLRGKALLFSRYRGTPAAVSAWLSIEVDRRASHQQTKGKFTAQAYLRPDSKAPWPLIALFMPWPTLSGALEPIRGHDLSINEVKRQARRDLRDWLKVQGMVIGASDNTTRKPWQLAFELEDLLGDSTLITKTLNQLGKLGKSKVWRHTNARLHVTPKEVALLADWLLEAPGAIVARTLRRHDPTLLTNSEMLPRVFRFSWRQLRQHLGQRYFAVPILGARRRRHGGGYPEALRRAMLEGGFEATLDEHVAVMTLIGDAAPLEVLEQSVVGRPGLVQRRTTRGVRRARVHAAAPYLGADRKRVTGENTDRKAADRKPERMQKLRSDTLRKAFNSPFWPHVLTTTSIGQDGLDFHVWCDRVIHWDLPRDPVDFEQREGRIARYASLGVRRALATAHGGAVLSAWKSPFGAIFEAARAAKSEGLGLERWWSPPDHKPVSITFSLPFSLAGLRLLRLRDDLVRYRLALGQPDPQLFEAMVEHFRLSHGRARELALNLSPAMPAE
jgi:hypothetical protein